MSGRQVFCVKFQKELPGLDRAPWPGDLGMRVYENVSIDAWKLWEERMKMILNEYRLMPWQKEAQDLSRNRWKTSSLVRAPRCHLGTFRSRPSSRTSPRRRHLLLGSSPSVANHCNPVYPR